MNGNMRRVYDIYKDNPDFMILSHTCDPNNDSVPVLKNYEKLMVGGKLTQREDKSYRVVADSTATFANKNWYFVTGDKKHLYDMARYGYMIDNGKPDTSQIENQFLHTQFFALVDKKNQVRGIYDGLEEEDIQQMIKDIDLLLNDCLLYTSPSPRD